MKKNIPLLVLLMSAFLFQQCVRINNSGEIQNNNGVVHVVDADAMKGEGEEQDGIKEAQEMEFEMTKDMSLGYIPKDRLINAYEKLMEDRRNSPTGPAGVSALTWTERGPNTDVIGPSNGNTRGTQVAADAVTSGRMRAIWVDIADATVWTGSISGGLWHTTDITSSAPGVWSQVNDFLGNLAISSITQDPTNTNIMYFGTGEKTFNADAVRGGGIWKSTNHGVTWALLPSTAAFNNISKILCDGAGNVYATSMGFPGASGVLRSIDGGTNWTTITPTGLTAYATDMKLSSTGRLHVACGYRLSGGTSGFRYTDNPATVTSASWTAPTTPIPATLTDYNVELAVAGNTLYAECSNSGYLVGGIYKSTDGGVIWAAVTTPPNTTTEPSIMTGAQAWYDLAIGCDPNNPNIVVAGGLNYYRSIDGGTTWTQITRWVGIANNYVHADHHAVVWNTNGTGAGTQVLLGTDGGIFYSSNNGVSYVDRNDGLRLKQFYSCAIHPTTTNYFIAGAQDNGTHQLINAGLGGSTEVVGGDGAYTHIDQDEPTYQFSAFTRSQYLRSTNGGANWGSVSFSTTIGQFINPTDYDDFFNRMYCSGNAGTYVRWENPQTGSTFNTIGIAAFNGSSVLSVQVSPHTANRVFFGTAGGRVVRVDNAQAATPTGTNITGSSMNTSTVSCVAVGTNDNNLLATFSNYGAAHVWASTTGGGAAGWTNISGNLPDIPVRWAMFYPENNTKAIIATELGVYETDLINGASTVWVQNSSFPVVKTTMLQYRKSDGILLAASYGRGLWTAPIPFTNPYTRFASDYNSQTEATTATTATCRNYRDYTVNMNIDQAPTGNANLTLSVAGGSTATQGVDFDFTTNGNFAAPSNIVTFANGTTTAQTVTIRIYNDAEVESEEFFTLNYSIGGGTNAVAAPSSQAFTFTIANNDVAPVIPFSGTNFGVGVNNFAINGASPFQGNLPKFRIQYLFTKDELNASGITSAGNITAMNIRVTTKGSTLPYTGFTISMGHTAVTTFSNYVTPAPAFTQVFTGNYSSVVGDNNFVFTTPFVWDGISNVVVQMCYDNTATTSVVDIMEGTDAPLGVGVRASVFSSATTGVGCSLAAAFISDTRIRAIFSADVSATPIESVLNTNKTEYIPGTGNHYFYNGANIISGLTAVSANLGCVTSNVFEAGNIWQVFNSGFRSQKVIDITPTTNSGATYTVSLYYTAAELTGQTPALLKIAKTNAATMATADGTNTVIAASTTVTPYGTGYIFSATFTGFSKFFLVNAGVALPVTLVSFSGTLNTQNNAALQWKISNEINLRSYEIERSYDGLQFTSAGIVSATAGGSLVKDYTFTDPVTAKSVNYYRLKMIDIDGRVKYSDVIILKNNRDVDFVQLLKNPVQNSIPLSINNKRKERITTELYSTTGQLISKWDIGSADGTVQLPFTNNIAPGIYTLRIIMGNKTVTLKISKQ